MVETTVLERIADLLEQQIQVPVERDGGHSPVPSAALQLDSMALLELSVCLEKEFGIALDDEELSTPAHFASIEALVALVERKISQ